MVPGEMAFTVMPIGAASRAATLTKLKQADIIFPAGPRAPQRTFAGAAGGHGFTEDRL